MSLDAMERGETIVYAAPGGKDYVALIGEQWRPLPDRQVW